VVSYDIDDLQAVVGANLEKREEEANKAQEIVQVEVATFEAWQQSLDVQPAIVALRKRFHSVLEEEFERAKLVDLSDEQKERVAILLRQFTNKLLHTPTTQLKKLAKDGCGVDHVDTLIQLFDLAEEIVNSQLDQTAPPQKVQAT
jgi:glutamyl-tRNA reductase